MSISRDELWFFARKHHVANQPVGSAATSCTLTPHFRWLGVFLFLLSALIAHGQRYDVTVIEPTAAQGRNSSSVLSEALNDRGEFVILANPTGNAQFGQLVLWLPEPNYGLIAGFHKVGAGSMRRPQLGNDGEIIAEEWDGLQVPEEQLGVFLWKEGVVSRIPRDAIPHGIPNFITTAQTFQTFRRGEDGDFRYAIIADSDKGRFMRLFRFCKWSGSGAPSLSLAPPFEDEKTGRNALKEAMHISDISPSGNFTGVTYVPDPNGGPRWIPKPFLWDGAYRAIGEPSPDLVPVVDPIEDTWSVNDLGNVVGHRRVNTRDRSFFFFSSPAGGLDAGLYTGVRYNSRITINNRNQILGRRDLWENSRWTALADLFPNEFTFRPGESIRGEALHNNGSMVLKGMIGGSSIRYFLLTPKIVVNSTGDRPRQAGEDSCFTGATIPGGAPECTLRSAIEAVNAGLGSRIEFDIPGDGVPVIAPGSPLPAITESIELDATTQPAVGRVCIDGQGAGAGADGLRLMGGEASEIRGFEVIGFQGAGIRVGGGLNHKLLGNLIGTNAAALSGIGNNIGMLLENVSGMLVGGVADGECNVISGNEDGVVAQNCDFLKFVHNLVGVAPDGNSPLPNSKRALFLKTMGGMELGNMQKPTPIMGLMTGAQLEGLQGFVARRLHVGVGMDGETRPLGQVDGLCLENCSDGQLRGGIFAGVSGTSMALVHSNRIRLEDVDIGTNGNGVGSLLGNIGLSVLGGGGHEIGKFGGELSVIAGKLAVSMQGLAGAVTALANVHIGVDHAGVNVIGDTEIGLLLENCTNVNLGGKHDGTGPDANSLIAGIIKAVEIKDSETVEATQFSLNTSADGQAGLLGGLGSIAMRLVNVSGANIGSLLAPSYINGITGVSASALSALGGPNRFRNLRFNLNADGDAALTDSMECAILIEDCFQAQLEEIKVGKAGTGIEIDQSGEIMIDQCELGAALAGLPEMPMETAIKATNSDDIRVTGGEIFANIGVLFQQLGGDSNQLADLKIGRSGAANEISRALSARAFARGGQMYVRNTTIGGVSGNAVVAHQMSHFVMSDSHFGVDEDDLANAIRGSAVQVTGGSTNVELRGNTFKNTSLAAVHVSGAGNQVVVRDNVMIDNGDAIVRDVVDETLRTLDITGLFQGSTHVSGRIQGDPGETLFVDFYAYDPAAAAVEARYYLGAATVTIDGTGNANFEEVFAPTAPAGWNATATVTNAEFGTSPLRPGMAIAPAPDSDNDGFPDTWEALYPDCFTVGVVDAPDEDCDGDGRSDLEEYTAGTDPAKPDEFSPGFIFSPDQSTITIPVLPGRRYTLERSVSLTESSWTPLWSQYVATAATIPVIDPVFSERAFYRLVVEIE